MELNAFQIGGIIALSFTIGIVTYRLIFGKQLKKLAENANRDIEAKRVELESEHKKKAEAKLLEIREQEIALRLKTESLEEKISELAQEKSDQQTLRSKLNAKLEELDEQKTELDKQRQAITKEYSDILKLSPEKMKEALEAQIYEQNKEELSRLKHQLSEKTESEIHQEASELLITAMQRVTTEPATEATATIVDLPSEDMKGRIIGREGRNIRSFEAATGTTLMIDETPDSVLISAFDPVKREVARIALEKLLKDGRIHPSTIEEAVETANKGVQENVNQLGEQAMNRLKLKPAPKEILTLLGKLHFRLSLNQNSLEHSIEVAYISSMLASELGLDPNIAKRAALFHDLGKAIDHEFEGSHAQAASKILERHNEDGRVVNAVAASHEEVHAESPYAPLVIVADRISAMRPGARTDSLDSYVERVKTLENTAKSFNGVKDAFALQAGREIRVIVEPDTIDDSEAQKLALNLSREIESSMNYPSTIKITVIRETRYCETAT